MRLDLAEHSRGVEPSLLSGDQPISQVKGVQHAKADRYTTANNAEEGSLHVAAGNGFVDHVLRIAEAQHRLDMQIENRGHDPFACGNGGLALN